MQGGVTSGVIYPLAACALAQRYVFRSIGGASVGAVAAAATAAAEYGRRTGAQDRLDAASSGESPQGANAERVPAGFPGLARIIEWLAPDTKPYEWRLAQLFQPSPDTRALYRVVAAAMQGRDTTGNSRIRCMIAALVLAVGWRSRLFTWLLLALWLVAPTALTVLVGAERWASVPVWIRWVLASVAALLLVGTLLLAYVTGRRNDRPSTHPADHAVEENPPLGGSIADNQPTNPTNQLAPDQLRWRWASRAGMTIAAVLPLIVAALVRLPLANGSAGSGPPAAVTPLAFATVVWGALTLAAAAGIVLVYGFALRHFIAAKARGVHFGLLPCTAGPTDKESDNARRLSLIADRLAGLPTPTRVSPLADWLADRIDDLAGRQSGYALTFGDLWTAGMNTQVALDRRPAPEERVIDLALMTTDLTQGRPYRLPFPPEELSASVEGWLFCPHCLRVVLPERVVSQMAAHTGRTKQSEMFDCAIHETVQLLSLPDAWDLPVVFAARMSLSFPGLIAAVPLVRIEGGKAITHWFSDGGITSNFPIHFFDTLFPLWPTFGLDIEPYPRNGSGGDVWLPPQTADPITLAPVPIRTAAGFLLSIVNTFQSWRDTLQSELPGFRGRIAHVRQGPSEGGLNLFMSGESICTLAKRGYDAGTKLVIQFSGEKADEDDSQTQWYRWLRMRISVSKLTRIADQVSTRDPVYKDLVSQIPSGKQMRSTWFNPAPSRKAHNFGGEIATRFTYFAASPTSPADVSDNFSIPAVSDPDLRLTPRE
jgi:predicted acylesterase/phospholipase RssA